MNIIKKWNEISLIKRIIGGLIIGIILGVAVPNASWIGIFGELFVTALKSIAPILVFFLVMHSLAAMKKGKSTNMKHIIVLYLIGTIAAAATAVIASYIFPCTLTLPEAAEAATAPPEGIWEVLTNILLNAVSNPLGAIVNANFIGVLVWAVIFGLALKHASDETKTVLGNVADAMGTAIKWVISCAPFGIMGLIFTTISTTGFSAFGEYARIILVLVGVMLFVAFIINPLIVFLNIRQNPYPLVFKCVKDSGIMAFFTRSSAANIPVNMELCKNLGLDEDKYSVSIPLGATINMAGAAITITVLTMATANTMGIAIDIPSAILLSVLASLGACGASGVAGGSLLLIPMACSMFGIPADIAMQVVGVGFIIGVIQDSCETALNSSSDALFTATAEYRLWKKEGKEIAWKKNK